MSRTASGAGASGAGASGAGASGAGSVCSICRSVSNCCENRWSASRCEGNIGKKVDVTVPVSVTVCLCACVLVCLCACVFVPYSLV